jgi:hypothetical protein
MPTKADLLSELNWVTNKISSQVWTLNVGTLGTTWSLLITGGLPGDLRFTTRNAIWIFVPCLLSLLAEMAQYLCAYRLGRQLLFDMEQNARAEFQYPTSSILYKSREFFFQSKVILTIAAAVILIFTVVRKYTWELGDG